MTIILWMNLRGYMICWNLPDLFYELDLRKIFITSHLIPSKKSFCNLEEENIVYTGPDRQKDAYIPRRLVAKCCVEAIDTANSIGKIIEITSNSKQNKISMKEAIESFKIKN